MKRWAIGMLVAVFALELFLAGAELLEQTSKFLSLFRASAAVEAPVTYQARLDGFAAELEELGSCYEIRGGDCDFPRTTPDSYRRALGQNLRATLLGLRDWSAHDHVRDARVAYLALPYLKSADAEVQDAALEVLHGQPARPEILDSLLAELIAGIPEPAAAKVRAELDRYETPADKARIAAAFAGAPAPAQ